MMRLTWLVRFVQLMKLVRLLRFVSSVRLIKLLRLVSLVETVGFSLFFDVHEFDEVGVVG